MQQEVRNTDVLAIIAREKFDAVLFDMDGVVTKTAVIHVAAWKETLDDFLKAVQGPHVQPFSESDYLVYVDGKAGEDGIRSFLKSRNLTLPEGSADDKPGYESISALGELKNGDFLKLMRSHGVEAYETTVSLIQALKQCGIKTAIISASKNLMEVISAANLSHVFDAKVDGIDALNMKLAGKPHPDTFLEAARQLGVSPERAVVIEDAIAGVAAGAAGHFGMVIGVARKGDGSQLLKNGANMVVCDLGEVAVQGSVQGSVPGSVPGSVQGSVPASVQDSVQSSIESSIQSSGSVAQQPQSSSPGTALKDLDISDQNWTVTFNSYVPQSEGQREALCALGNGYFATRAAAPESRADGVHYPGTYLAGAYNRLTTDVNGTTIEFEEIVNMPNWLSVSFKIEDDDWFDLATAEVLSYQQQLKMYEGVLYRQFTVRDRTGRQTTVAQRWFVHMSCFHLAGFEMNLTADNWSGSVIVRSAIDGRVTNSNTQKTPNISSKHLLPLESTIYDDTLYLKMVTSQSGIVVAMSAKNSLTNGGSRFEIETRDTVEPDFVAKEMRLLISQGQSIDLQKTVSVYTSRDQAISEPGLAARNAVGKAPDFATLLYTQMERWRHLWNQFDLFIETTEEYSKMFPSLLLHLHSFHVLQTASPNIVDLDNGVPARGWTGEGYQGHVFWDDLFIFPFINLRMPEITKALLKYRYRRLDQAREIAKSLGARGARFPWQSGSTGDEDTSNYVWIKGKNQWALDATHMQIHVGAAIAYNIWQYYQVTANMDFMITNGAEMLLEIARFFATFAKHNQATDRYEIHGILGPDEYHNGYPGAEKAGIDNNAYTNVMAVWTIVHALEVLQSMPADHREALSRLLQCCKLWPLDGARSKGSAPTLNTTLTCS